MKKSNNNDKNKIDSKSNFNNFKRSSKFDDLLGKSSRPNGNPINAISPKERFKKIWKWVSIGIYLFLAGLGVTGFIQSCVLRVSSTVGAGVELYNSQEDVAPYVSTYRIVEKEKDVIDYDSNGNPIIDEKTGKYKTKKVKYYALEKDTKDNYLTPREDIVKIKNNLQTSYGRKYNQIHGDAIRNLYGQYDNYSSSLRIINTTNNQSYVIRNDKAPIFMNNKIINYLDENGMSYINQNNLYDINIFTLKRPNNINDLPNSQKDYYGTGITNISSAFETFEEINGKWVKVEVINGNYFTKDVNADGIIDSDTYIQITDLNRISKFRYSLNAEVATLSQNTTGLFNTEKFARDYYQSMNDILIKSPQMNEFYELVSDSNNIINSESAIEDIYKVLTKDKLQSLINPSVNARNNTGIDQRAIQVNKLFTLKQKNAIITYQNEISSLLTKSNFGIRKQVYSDETSDNYEPNTAKPFSLEFAPTVKNKKNLLLGIGSAAQKPITSWGESWRLGPFYGLIVWPISFLINSMMDQMPPLNGWDGIIAIVATILITRIIVTLFTYKTLFSSHKQQQLNPKKAKIDAKYAPFKGNREMEQRKRQELAKLYKANNVSMIDPLKAMCISMPIFFAVWRVVQGIPDIKSTTWLGIQFSLTSWRELFNGAWQYLPLLITAAGIQALSQYLPRLLNRKRMSERANKAEQAALKQSNKTQNIVMIVFIAISVMFEAGVQIYWIIGGLWQIMQILVVHHIVKGEWYRTKGYKYL